MMSRTFPPDAWTLERFGFTPAKMRHRVIDRDAPKVFCDSIPKAGTHLLERAVCLHPRMYRKLRPTIGDGNVVRWHDLDGALKDLGPGQVLVSHLSFHDSFPQVLRDRGVSAIFLMRDPRDIVVSQVHFVTSTEDHRQHATFASVADPKERLRLSIVGDPARNIASIAERLDRYAGWLTSGALVVRFEDLVGSGGGGDPQAQERGVRAIYRYLGLEEDERLIEATCAQLFSNHSPTFRKGAIGQWHDHFDDELEALFALTVGDRMRPYGYELTRKEG
jgi:hypothetical protein